MTLRRLIRLAAEKTLPRKGVMSLWFLYGVLKAPQKSCSQKGEDLLVLSYFNGIGVKRGTYCDIGCFHPVWISNTHLLDRNGWTGFAIDIDDFKLASMKVWRKSRVQCMLGAVCGKADEGETASVYKFRSGGGWSDLDTLDRATAESYQRNGAGDFEESTVNLLDINKLFASFPHINFLNIDIEGVDIEVILALDLVKYRPNVILFEDNENWGGGTQVKYKLSQSGYERLFVSRGSVCYALPPKTWTA
jgi:hypothetical protein